MARPDWIEVGRVRRAHGVRGEVRVAPSTDNPDRFVPGARLFARPSAAPGDVTSADARRRDARRELEVVGVRGDPGLPIVAFAGITTREAAEALRGATLEVPATALPDLDEGEFYPFDLEGLAARRASGERLGEVAELLEAPANDVLVVALDDGRRLLVPFVEAAVPVVDVGAGYLVVDDAFLEPALDIGSDQPGGPS